MRKIRKWNDGKNWMESNEWMRVIEKTINKHEKRKRNHLRNNYSSKSLCNESYWIANPRLFINIVNILWLYSIFILCFASLSTERCVDNDGFSFVLHRCGCSIIILVKRLVEVFLYEMKPFRFYYVRFICCSQAFCFFAQTQCVFSFNK